MLNFNLLSGTHCLGFLHTTSVTILFSLISVTPYTAKEKLSENFVILTGCNRLKYQWDETLFQHADQVNLMSSNADDGIF